MYFFLPHNVESGSFRTIDLFIEILTVHIKFDLSIYAKKIDENKQT